MVTKYGMSDKLGHLTYGIQHEQIFLGRDMHEDKNYSDETALTIDKEVKRIVDECYEKARTTLLEHESKLKLLAEKLLEKEVMADTEVKELLGFGKENKHGSGNKPRKKA